MSGTFDEQNAGSSPPGKRPAPTIEGTATEVSVEPESQEATPEATKSAESESETAALEAPHPGDSDAAEATEDSAADGDVTPEDGLSEEATGDDEAETGAEAQPVPVPQEPARPSFGSRLLAFITALFTHALAGLAGGLAVLAALVWGYLPPPQQDSGRDNIETRIAALETAPNTPDNTAALEDLKSRLAELESSSGDAESVAVDPAEVEALSAQVAQIEASLKSMAEAAKDGGSVADAAAISRQIAEAEQRLDSELQAKIQSEVESALASGAGAAADEKTVLALKSEVSELNAKLKALTEATMGAPDGSALKPEIAALQRRLNEIETTLPSLVDAVDAENAQTRKANLAIAFSGLREAVNSGRPFATELAAMSVLSGDGAELQALAEYENTGIPTVPMLAESFASLRDKALAVQPDTEPDLLGRLMGSAQSLVKVKRIGEETEGTGPEGTLARAEAALKAGKLDDAVLEVERLDEPHAKLFGHWTDDALARLDADTALQRLQEALLVSLAEGNEASGKTRSPAADEVTE